VSRRKYSRLSVTAAVQSGAVPRTALRLRGEGRGEGLFFELGQEGFEDTVEILDDIIVPDADHPITEGAEVAVALLV
jgi:hypothetical protein